MIRVVAMAVAATATFVAAAPAAKPGPPMPPCIPSGDGRLAVDGGAVILCSKPYNAATDLERCFEVSRAGLGKPVTPPPPPASNPLGTGVVRDEAGALSACAAKTCKPLGKALVAAIAAAKKDAAANGASPPALQTTDDLAVVIVDGKAWSLRADKLLGLVPPKAYAKPSEVLGGSATVMGTLMVSTWTTCAGPCEKAIVADARGKNRGAMFDAGILLRVDDKRVAVISAQQYQTITILDFATGKILGTLDLGSGEEFAAAVRLDDHTFAMSLGADFHVSWIDVTKNTPKRVAGPISVARCAD